MRERRLAHLGIGISQRAVLVALVLEYVGIDGADAHSVLRRGLHYRRHVRRAVREVPKHVDGDARATARDPVNGPGVGDLLLSGGGRGQLDEFAEPCPRVGESPGGQFDGECIQSRAGLFQLPCGDHRYS